MDSTDAQESGSSPTPDGDEDEVNRLKQKLVETEEKLVKFKNFVVNLRHERQQLKDKITEHEQEIDKLKSAVAKHQTGRNNQQIYQNFQKLQSEYDKVQDEIESHRKAQKALEGDLFKCTEELNRTREACENLKEENQSLRGHIQNQSQQIETLANSNRECEGRIIILEEKLSNEIKRSSEFEACEKERDELREELRDKLSEIEELSAKIGELSSRIVHCEQVIEQKDQLIEKYDGIEQENQRILESCQKNSEIIETNQDQIEQYQQSLAGSEAKVRALELRVSQLESAHSEKISSLDLIISDLETKLRISEEDLQTTNAKFDDYKLKVVNVLKESKVNSFDYNKNIENLNLKLEKLEEENRLLREKSQTSTNETTKIRRENSELKEELAQLRHQVDGFERLKQQYNTQSSENDKLSLTIKNLQVSFAKEKKDIVEENVANLENLKLKYETRLKELEEEIVNLNTNRNTPSDDSNSIVNSNTSFEEIREENLSLQSTNSSFEKNFLEEILCSDSGGKPSSTNMSNGSNIDNLTQLLAESENSISLLSEQNRLLKEEIRRLHRSIERVDVAENMEYLKNVLLKFMTIKGVDEKERLITVLTTILKLTSEERDVFQECVTGGQSKSAAKWNLWQWS